MSALNVFAGLLVLSFGATVLLTGTFTASMGAGKSRKIGIGLVLTGLVVIAFFISATWNVAPGIALEAWTPDEMALGLAGVAGATIGTVVALGAFLFSIMKA